MVKSAQTDSNQTGLVLFSVPARPCHSRPLLRRKKPLMSESSQASRNTIGDEPELLSRGRSSAVNDRHNHELARAIVGAVRDPLVLLDRSLRVVAASDSFINWFRLERSATWGRS